MYESEEPDESSSPAMRWVFDELEAEFEAGLRREAEQEAVAAVRTELGATLLWEQLARRLGGEATIIAGARTFRGTAVASYPEFLVLRAADGTEHLIRYGAAVSVALPAEPPPLRPTPASANRRYQLAFALRELARRREPGQGGAGRCDQVRRHHRSGRQRLPGDRRARAGRGAPPGGGAGTPVRRVRSGRGRHDSSGAPMSGCLRAQSAVSSCMRSM